MTKDKKKPKGDKKKREAPEAQPADALRPSDSEVSFEHLLRDMAIAREEARRKGS